MIVLALAATTSAQHTFMPSRQAFISRDFRTLSVSLVKVQRNAENGIDAFVLEVRNKIDGSRRSFRITNPMVQLDDIASDENHLVVLGSVSGTIRIVTVVEVTNLEHQEWFYCFRPTVSPDGRLVAFLRFIQRNAPDASCVYLAYDVAAPRGGATASSPDRHQDVGVPIYPKENVVERSYAPRLGSDRLEMLASDELSWLNNSVVAFVSWAEGETRLVVIDLSTGIDKPLIHETRLERDPGRCGPERPSMNVTKITPVRNSPGTVRLHFAPQACRTYTHVDVRWEK